MTHQHFIDPAVIYHEASSDLWNRVNAILIANGQRSAHGGEFGFYSDDGVRGRDPFDVRGLRSADAVADDIIRARTYSASDEECLMAAISYRPLNALEGRWTFTVGDEGGVRPTLDSALKAVSIELSLRGMSLREDYYVVQRRKMEGRWEDLRMVSNAVARQRDLPFEPMTADTFAEARRILGNRWGHPLSAADFGRLLGFGGRDPGLTVLDYEKGKRPVTGPVALAVQLMLDGARPADLEARLTSPAPRS